MASAPVLDAAVVAAALLAGQLETQPVDEILHVIRMAWGRHSIDSRA